MEYILVVFTISIEGNFHSVSSAHRTHDLFVYRCRYVFYSCVLLIPICIFYLSTVVDRCFERIVYCLIKCGEYVTAAQLQAIRRRGIRKKIIKNFNPIIWPFGPVIAVEVG